MKKRFRIIALILTLALAILPVISVPAVADTATENGKLTITELNSAMDGTYYTTFPSGTEQDAYANSVSYQYMELENFSDRSVDLSDYWVCRYSHSNTLGAWDWAGLSQMLEGANGKIYTKVRITDESLTVKPGQVVVVWFCNRSELDIEAFKTFWGLSDKDAKIVKMDISAYPACNGTNANEEWTLKGTGFLPLISQEVLIEIVSNKHEYNGVTVATDSSTVITDTALTQARHAASDSMAVYYTVYGPNYHRPFATIENGKEVSRHFYNYIDVDKYSTNATQLKSQYQYPTGTDSNVYSTDKINSICKSIVHGKLADNGDYAVGEGLMQYLNRKENNESSMLFVDDGDREAPTPGRLSKGQFNTLLNAPTYFGVQSKLNGDGTYSVRFSATVDAEVLNCKKLGFDVKVTAINKSSTTVPKTLDKDCYLVYTSIYGKGTNGEEQYTQSDITNGDEYFYTLTVKGISIDGYQNVTFEVTPRVHVDDTTVLYGKSFTVTYNDGVLQQ